jgi:predicted DNA-binding protein (UPF0251 family)
MSESIMPMAKLEELAEAHAREVVTAEATNGAGTTKSAELFEEFRRARQPFLSDKQYTALFHTYSDRVMTAIENLYKPSSRTARPPVPVSSIADNETIYRPNPIPMSEAQWKAHTIEFTPVVESFAREIARLARTDAVHATQRCEEFDIEAVKYAMDRGLNDEEQERHMEIYRRIFMSTLEAEAGGKD